MKAPLHSYTELSNRTLWYDGSSVYDPSSLMKIIGSRRVKYVTAITPDIQEFNSNVAREQELQIKSQCDDLNTDWNIPDEYKTLDVIEYVAKLHESILHGCPDSEQADREHRLAKELVLMKKHGFFDMIRAIIYVINTLTETNTVWGIGRGSSVSSYVLYIIGAHDVDSFLYDLDINDFIRDE